MVGRSLDRGRSLFEGVLEEKLIPLGRLLEKGLVFGVCFGKGHSIGDV